MLSISGIHRGFWSKHIDPSPISRGAWCTAEQHSPWSRGLKQGLCTWSRIQWYHSTSSEAFCSQEPQYSQLIEWEPQIQDFRCLQRLLYGTWPLDVPRLVAFFPEFFFLIFVFWSFQFLFLKERLSSSRLIMRWSVRGLFCSIKQEWFPYCFCCVFPLFGLYSLVGFCISRGHLTWSILSATEWKGSYWIRLVWPYFWFSMVFIILQIDY